MSKDYHATPKPGQLTACLHRSVANPTHPYAVRVFTLDEDMQEVHVDTLLVRDKESGRKAVTERFGLPFCADLTAPVSIRWKEILRCGAPRQVMDVRPMMMELFNLIRRNAVGHATKAETDEAAERVRVALGFPTWSSEQAEGYTEPLPFAIQTPYGAVYGQKEAIAYVRELMEKDTACSQ